VKERRIVHKPGTKKEKEREMDDKKSISRNTTKKKKGKGDGEDDERWGRRFVGTPASKRGKKERLSFAPLKSQGCQFEKRNPSYA